MNNQDELGVWAFHYYSEDGNGHEITITAKTLNDAVKVFHRNIGEDIIFELL